MAEREVFIVGAARTAIGTYGGTLKDTPLADLATAPVKEALKRSGAPLDAVGHLVMGTVVPTEPRDCYLSRVAAINAGLSHEVPAFNVNRLCGSGLQAIVSATQAIKLGDTDVAVGAGAESMSRGPYNLPAMRWGARLSDSTVVDFVEGALRDPFQRIHMGVTAENVAERYQITRDDQDALALSSQQRAVRAIDEGRFKDQIVSVEVKSRKGPVPFDTDEFPRRDASVEQLGKLKPVFKKEGGSVTAGNASGLNDGAGAVVLAEGSAVKSHNLKPLARIVAYAHAGVEPAYMGIGPVPASRAALKRAGLKLSDIDVIEANEAFAAQACAVSKEMGFDPNKVNPNGSGISLGHPIGGTGAIITIKCVYELQRIKGRYGLVTMCIGGGQGIAMIIERV